MMDGALYQPFVQQQGWYCVLRRRICDECRAMLENPCSTLHKSVVYM